MTKKVIYEKKDFIATVTINRPEVLNCFDTDTLHQLSEAYLDAAADDNIAVVVITGTGKQAFCTGADLKEQQEKILPKPNDYHKWMYGFIEMHDRLRNIGKVTIARLNGMVVGGGNELNIACDLAIAADHVKIKQVGPARGSVPAGGATQWLPLIIGDRRAREMLFLCEDVSAQKALEWGLVNQVVPYDELDKAVLTLATKLYNKLPECTRYTKQQINFWRDLSWSMTIGHARDWLTLHAGMEEVQAGLESFYNKSEMDYAAIRKARSSITKKQIPAKSHSKNDSLSCKKCQKTMPADHKFCGSCGQNL